MQKLAIALAALAAMGFSATAFAEEATTGSTSSAPAAMTDSQMDAVTAGAIGGGMGANETFGNTKGCGGPAAGMPNCAGGLAGHDRPAKPSAP